MMLCRGADRLRQITEVRYEMGTCKPIHATCSEQEPQIPSRHELQKVSARRGTRNRLRNAM